MWSFDEHRLGLQPIKRRVWSKKAHRPLLPVEIRYQWIYLNGFVNPEEGKTYWLLMPSVNINIMNMALREFAKAQEVGKEKRIILVLDGAGFHNRKALRIPRGLHLEFLPPYSPELQPAERLWSLTNECVVNRHFIDLDELENQQIARCLVLIEDKEKVKNNCLFHWWPKINSLSTS